MKKMARKFSILLVIIVFFSWSGFTALNDFNGNPNADRLLDVMAADDIRVTTANLNLRSGPGTSYSILAVIPKGTKVNVISVSGNWAKVTYSGKQGYASISYLTKVTTNIMVTTANLNMRTGPATSYSIIRVIPNGAQVTVLSTSSGWAKVTYGGSTGYASLSYLKPAGTTTHPPTSADIRITTAELNLRSGPGTSYSIIAVMPSGAKVTVLSVSGSWAKVTYAGKTGYAHTAYLVKQGTYASSTVITKGLVTSSSKQIALTFDAGWEYATTIPLLNMLDRYGVKATFFLRAYWVRDNLALAKEILKRGHSIQNHSLTHPHMKTMTESEIRNEFVQSTKIFRDYLGITPNQFRPPFGEYDSRVLKIAGEQGYKYTVMWSIDTIDWAESSGGVTITKDYITNKVLNNVTDKDIVLMHIAYQKTVDALPRMIETLKSRGYTFKTVPQMAP
ncbi:SH3 domain-containing protein [Proteiniclasticum sp.]|uniref:SH3 domain-containing protein n=1 Tax=Proteiniclasticum sp. TaxID=2053595 RepID=UPI0028995498|nr:SH3 domain-containing protein [Proteiniclasticum sp.]